MPFVWSVRSYQLWPPVEARRSTSEAPVAYRIAAASGNGNVEFGAAVEISASDWLIDTDPEGFSGLKLATAGRQQGGAEARGDGQWRAVPAGVVENEVDDLLGLDLVGGRSDENSDAVPLAAMVGRRDRV